MTRGPGPAQSGREGERWGDPLAESAAGGTEGGHRGEGRVRAFAMSGLSMQNEVKKIAIQQAVDAIAIR